jgi:cytoskeleton protein RodZ
MTEPTQPPGARLKSERERRGMSLQKAADEMRLDAWVIEALERDQYERVGPAVYAKGHLKKYASVLGVPWDEILSGYEALRTAPASPQQVAPSMRMRAPAPDVSTLPRAQIAGIVVLLVGVAGLLVWKPWQQRPVLPAPVPAQARSAAAAPASVADPDQAVYAAGNGAAAGTAESPTESGRTGPAPAPTVAGGVTGAKPVTDATGAPGHGPTRLRLSFSAESWVDIHDADGKRVYSGYGRANSVKSLAGDGPLKVYLGYASGVQLEINERAVAIASPFVHGDVARFQAGADGVLRSFTTPSG